MFVLIVLSWNLFLLDYILFLQKFDTFMKTLPFRISPTLLIYSQWYLYHDILSLVVEHISIYKILRCVDCPKIYSFYYTFEYYSLPLKYYYSNLVNKSYREFPAVREVFKYTFLCKNTRKFMFRFVNLVATLDDVKPAVLIPSL